MFEKVKENFEINLANICEEFSKETFKIIKN